MSSNVLCVSLLFAVIVAASVSQTAGQEYSWKKLNKQLIRDGEDVDDYIRLATKRLEKAKHSCFRDKNMIATLERLDDFKLTVQEPKCDPETLAYIKSFSDEIKDYPAIKYITRSYLKATADKCREMNINFYIEKMIQLKSDGLSEAFHGVQTFFTELTYSIAMEWLNKVPISRGERLLVYAPSYYTNWARQDALNQKSVYHGVITKNLPLGTGINADIAYDAIETLVLVAELEDIAGYVTKNDLGKRVITQESARELFDRWILQPCELYVKELGPAVFEYAEVAREVCEYPVLPISVRDDRTSRYYFGWAQYQGCLRLINDQGEREKLLGYLGKIAEIQTKVRSNPDQTDFLAADLSEIPDLKPEDFKTTTRALDKYQHMMDELEEDAKSPITTRRNN